MNTKIPSSIPDITQPNVAIGEIVYESNLGWSNKEGESPNNEVHKIELPDGTPMAVKTPKQGTIKEFEEPELKQEAAQWEKFADEDYIVGLYDHGETKAYTPYIAMEMMDMTLESYLANGHIGSLQQRLWILNCLIDALEVAHGHDVAHQDLKPSNILFRTVEDHWDVPKIGDWGSASDLIQGHDEMFSPPWAAPEQVASTDVEFASIKMVDVFQFGLIMYLLLTDTHPLPNWSNEKPPKDEYQELLSEPSSKRAGINAELDALTMECLAYDPVNRPVNARVIQKRLDEITGALFVEAR